jgi:hypothetical protein
MPVDRQSVSGHIRTIQVRVRAGVPGCLHGARTYGANQEDPERPSKTQQDPARPSKTQQDPAILADDPLLYMSVKRMKLKRARNVS